MTTSNDLNKLTRKMYLTYQKDGLIDIAAGAAIMGLGAWYFNLSTAVAFLSLLPFIFFDRLKNWITVPRLGILNVSPQAAGRKSTIWLLGILVAVLLGVSILGILGALGLLPDGPTTFFKQPYLVLVLITALVIAVIGTVLAIRSGGFPIFWYARVFLYAGIYLVIIIADIGFRITNGPVVAAIGAIILLAGVGQLLVFLSRHPISRPEEL